MSNGETQHAGPGLPAAIVPASNQAGERSADTFEENSHGDTDRQAGDTDVNGGSARQDLPTAVDDGEDHDRAGTTGSGGATGEGDAQTGRVPESDAAAAAAEVSAESPGARESDRQDDETRRH